MASRVLTSRKWPAHSIPRRQLFTSAAPPPRTPIRTALITTTFLVSAGLFAVYYLDARSAVHRYFITPLLRYALDAETGHKVAVRVLGSGLGPKDPLPDDERLRFKLWGHSISNPVGVAAGFDKDGVAIDGLFDLGFSWVEIGSVTPKPQPGNPRPRIFHLPEDSALVNRVGFPSQGHSAVLARIRARIPRFASQPSQTAAYREGSVLAVSLGKNKESPLESIDDYVEGVRVFGPHADVLVINISSPNTPGLRGLQTRYLLETLLVGVNKAREQLPEASPRPRIVLKLAPDLDDSQIRDIATAIRSNGVDGIIVSNTTVSRPPTLVHASKVETGGLSGTPLKEQSLAILKSLRTQLPASIPLIGCGGIFTGADAIEYARAGATMVQIYTGLGYDGAGACRRIKDQIVDTLAKEGKTWEQLVTAAVGELAVKPQTPRESTVKELISEAEELTRLLDQLGTKLEAA